MTEQDSGARDPREEAERLIASVLGSASVAAENLRGFATGSAECCVCPVCRAIAAAREPNPQVAEKLASGAGDLASGVANLLRTMARAAGDFGAAGSSGSGAGSAGSTGSSGSGAGSSGSTGSSGSRTSAAEDPWHTATRAAAEAEAGTTAKPAAPGAAEPAAPGAAKPAAPGAAEPAATPNPPRPMAKKAVKPKAPAEPPAESPGATVDSPETDEER